MEKLKRISARWWFFALLLGFLHLPLLLISLYCAVLSYRHPAFRP